MFKISFLVSLCMWKEVQRVPKCYMPMTDHNCFSTSLQLQHRALHLFVISRLVSCGQNRLDNVYVASTEDGPRASKIGLPLHQI